jgi:PAS domain S-box-containing protein
MFAAFKLTVTIGIAYFLAARLGLALRGQVGVAIFWPAAGIAAGALIALGPPARLPVAIAVAFASLASSLTVNRNLWLAITFAVLDVCDTLLLAWLIARWFGTVFKLERVPQVVGFLVASTITAAVTAVVAAFAISFCEPAALPFNVWRFNVWRLWFASCALGFITIAPLLIGLGDALREPPPRRELVEGAIALSALAVLSVLVVSLSPGPWTSALPAALAFPMLLWVAVRCRPLFAAAAMFVVTLAVVWSVTFDLGHFDAGVPFRERILAAQTIMLAGTLLALVLAALFSERRDSEAALKGSKERLELALDGAELGAFGADLTTGRLECDARTAQIHGHDRSPTTITELRRFIHADDNIRMDATLVDAKRGGGRWDAHYRVIPPPGHPHAGETRWIAADSAIVHDRQGAPLRLLGVTRDITERKRAEQVLADLNVQRALAGRSGFVGTYAYDVDSDTDDAKAQISPGYAAIHGLPEGTTEITRAIWLARVHPADAERLQVLRRQAFHQRRREYSVDYRIVRDGEVRWIESRTFISYKDDGRPQRVIGVNIDVTDRKRSEALLSESKDRLADAMVAGQVMAFDWDAITRLSRRSENAESILGSRQGSASGSPRTDFLNRVHPDDRARLKKHIRTLRPDDPAYALSFRYVRPDGRQVWLEETARGEFDATGRLLRIKGLTRDITERKQAENTLAERNAQLALAGQAALVGSYAYESDLERMTVSEGYAAIHGLPEGTTETTRSAWRARVHPDDLERMEGFRQRAFGDKQHVYNVEYRIIRASGEVRWIESRSLISYDNEERPLGVIGINIDITERKRAEERQRVLAAELDHRVKNVLATVSAIITQTQEASSSQPDFVNALNRRINSLARTHELLSESNWRGASLAEIVRREFAPYATGNSAARGPGVTLKAEATQAVATVLHELTTNAAKYGAFSRRTGRVSVQWRWLQNGSRQLVIEWQETGGPPVSPPSRSGYGTSIIRELIPFELGGKVELDFASEGIRCRLEIPADWVSRGAGLTHRPGVVDEQV